MSVLSTEALFAIMMAAECAVRGDFIASLKPKMTDAQYLELMLNMKHHPEEFIKAREEAEARFAKNSQHNAFLNLVRLSNSEDEHVSLRASLGILRMDLSKRRQKLEYRRMKLRERIQARIENLEKGSQKEEMLNEEPVVVEIPPPAPTPPPPPPAPIKEKPKVPQPKVLTMTSSLFKVPQMILTPAERARQKKENLKAIHNHVQKVKEELMNKFGSSVNEQPVAIAAPADT